MNKTVELLGDKAEYLLSHTCKTIDKITLHLPSPHTSRRYGQPPTAISRR